MFQIILIPCFIFLILVFPFLTHPLRIGVTLLISTILISLIVGVLHSSIWVSYVTVLILLGGLLVIFIYVSLLASNEIFNKKASYKIPVTFSILTFLILVVINPFIVEPLLSSNESMFYTLNKKRLEWLTDFYSMELSSLTLFLIFYLLLTLLIVVFNTKNNHRTLRSSF